MIFDHDHPAYRARWEASGKNRWNGAYYYSREIVERIIPNVSTDRNWVTVNELGYAFDHSIVFIHNNKNPDRYDWLAAYDDLVLVCGVPETCPKVAHLGRPFYLPLSIDVRDVERYRCEKTKGTAFVGRRSKRRGLMFPAEVDIIEGLQRYKMLSRMAKYKRVYAVGRTAIEAVALGCEVLPYDSRFPDPSFWRVVDNLEAAALLQEILDGIDR